MHQLYKPHIERAGYAWYRRQWLSRSNRDGAASEQPRLAVIPRYHDAWNDGLSTVSGMKIGSTKPCWSRDHRRKVVLRRKRELRGAGAMLPFIQPFGAKPLFGKPLLLASRPANAPVPSTHGFVREHP